MLIKKVVLHNIRSYTDAEINFSAGKTLIAGDIGSGKSTILLAIEFALFGLLKGDISGDMLLRHGTSEGFVELHFEANSAEIIIHRKLKRSSKSIEQAAGFIVKNGRKTDLTPTEIKAQTLSLLGYPSELLTQSKSLLFRYTIYTPQEDMRKILFGDAEERLNIIRRVFAIDKYKRVRENSDIYAKHLREKQKELSGRIMDLPEKKLRLQAITTELVGAKNSLKLNEPILESAKLQTEQCRLQISQLEADKKQHSELKRSFEVCDVALKHFSAEKSRILLEAKQASDRLATLKIELDNAVIPDKTQLLQEIALKTAELNNFEKQKVSLITDSSRNSTIQKLSSDIIQKMSSLDTCPLCLQKVSSGHKDSIISAESSKIASAKESFANFLVLQKEIDANIFSRKNEIDALKLKEKSVELLRFKQNDLVERSKALELLSQRTTNLENEISQSLVKKNVLAQELTKFSTIEEQYSSAKKMLDSALLQEKNAEIQHNILTEKVLNIEKNKTILEAEIAEKEKFVSQSNSLKRLSQWIVELFCPLVESIEKQVLACVYNEFNELFKRWFSMLVEDEMFSARLDDSFSPVLQQNGFDTLPENLSGGEKTACALAYRLALNKVVNDIMTLVQTKDLLILDEPTDGFSDAQLDKVGEVLDNLGLKQIIIVSHERKIEGFVDNILQLTKERHVSGLR